MKKAVLILVVLVFGIPAIVCAADLKAQGTPFQALQQQIDELRILLNNIPQGPPGPAGRQRQVPQEQQVPRERQVPQEQRGQRDQQGRRGLQGQPRSHRRFWTSLSICN